MYFFVLGLAEKVAHSVLSNISRKLPDHQFFGIPRRSAGLWPTEAPEKYLTSATEYVTSELSTRVSLERPAAAFIWADDLTQEMFKSRLGHSLLLRRFPLAEAITANRERLPRVANTITTQLFEACIQENTRIKQITIEVRKTTSSPSLLPIKNFSSSQLEAFLEALIFGMDVSESSRELETLRHEIWQGDGFVDQQGLVYRSPGRYLHGERRPEIAADKCPLPSCFLEAHYRLGVKIHPGFHYDCQYKRDSKAKIAQRSFTGCHGQTKHVQRDYVNIYPNDMIR